jgi:hypothetical protein
VVLTVWEGNEDASVFFRSLGYAPVCHVLSHSMEGACGGTLTLEPSVATAARGRRS